MGHFWPFLAILGWSFWPFLWSFWSLRATFWPKSGVPQPGHFFGYIFSQGALRAPGCGVDFLAFLGQKYGHFQYHGASCENGSFFEAIFLAFWPICGSVGQNWPLFGHFWSFIFGHLHGTFLGHFFGHFGQKWVIFGHFWSFIGFTVDVFGLRPKTRFLADWRRPKMVI